MRNLFGNLAHGWIVAALFVLLGAQAAPAYAECAVSITGPGANGSLGMIVAGTSATTYSIPVSGPVTQTPSLSGGGSILLHPPTSFFLNVQIIGGSTCPDTLTVTFSALGNKFTTANTLFTVSNFSGMSNVSIASGTTVSNGGSFSFTFPGGGATGNASFVVGTTIALPASPTPGSAGWTTTISVTG